MTEIELLKGQIDRLQSALEHQTAARTEWHRQYMNLMTERTGTTLSPIERGIFGEASLADRLRMLKQWAWFGGASADVMNTINETIERIEQCTTT